MAASRAIVLALLSCGSVSAQELNVYGKPMSSCGVDHAAGCTYVAQDAGAHEVCVTTLPDGFSSDTGQGPWSDQFAGEPWCICIWAYSNYILQKKDLALDCNAIPAKVLEEQYSMDKFKMCGSMSSSAGCGPEDIRRSIQSLCDQCNRQSTDGGEKAALKGRCDAILPAAPAAPMQRLYDDSRPKSAALEDVASRGLSTSTLSMCLLALAGLFVTTAVVLRTSRHAETAASDEAVDDIE